MTGADGDSLAAPGAARRLAGDSNYALGALLVVAAVGCIAASDMFAKLLSERYDALEIVFWRALIGGALIAAMAAHGVVRSGRRRIARPGLQLLRGLLATAAVALFFWGLTHAPFAEAVAVSATAPLFMVILGALLLGERIRPAFWASLAIGSVGVWFILRPGGLAHQAALPTLSEALPYLAILAASLCYALVSVTTRAMAGQDRADLTAAITYGVMVVASGLALVAGGPTPPAAADAPLLVGLGASGALGMVAYAYAYVHAGVANLAPWDNMVFPWALGFSLVVFAETPDAAALLGGGLIMASGLLVSWLR